MKRKSAEDDLQIDSPRKLRRFAPKAGRSGPGTTPDSDDIQSPAVTVMATSSKRNRAQRKAVDIELPVSTPIKRRKLNHEAGYITPTKALVAVDYSQVLLVRNPDRSARRKSARNLLTQTTVLNDIDEQGLEEDAELAQRILDEDGEDESAHEEAEHDLASVDEQDILQGTPSIRRRGRPRKLRREPTPTQAGEGDTLEDEQADARETPSKRKRGRPKKDRAKRTPTPPRNLPSCEHYFFQNRPGGVKTSNNTLSSVSLLSHETYFQKISAYRDPHLSDIAFLHSLHTRSFEHWAYELEQGFNVCLYGWGSKRALLLDFAAFLSDTQVSSKIVVVNGYIAGLTIRDILTTVASAIPSLLRSQKLGAQPDDVLNTIIDAMSSHPPATPLTLLINTLDSASLRRPLVQALLARLASCPHIHLVATADTPNFSLLWDAALQAQFKWLFHDTTTFRSFDIELAGGGGGGGVVDEVNALLGRSGRRMHGREGVMYVLRSLTENARSLFGLLIAELLSLDDLGDNDDAAAFSNTDDEAMDFENALSTTPSKRYPGKRASPAARAAGAVKVGIAFRALYAKAAAQFIATNEPTFRGLLREFYDHEMLVSRKDALGGEVFGVPFRREEMEAILGELGDGV